MKKKQNNREKARLKETFKYAHVPPNATEVERLKAELDMAIGLIISQKMVIVRYRAEVKKLHDDLSYRPPATIDPLIKHVKDW